MAAAKQGATRYSDGTTEHYILPDAIETVPYSTQRLKVTLTNSPAACDDWCQRHILNLKCESIGLDCEWRPNFEKGQNNRIALIQVSTRTNALLYRVLDAGVVPPCMVKVMASTSILKAGASITKSDAVKLYEDWGVEMLGRVDLPGGLKRLCDEQLSYKLSKPKKVTCSNWERPLNERQIRYAALDAWISLVLMEHLRKTKDVLRSDSRPIEEILETARSRKQRKAKSRRSKWNCTACTFTNEAKHQSFCAMCQTPKPGGRECAFYNTRKGCRNGSTCKFTHVDEVQRPARSTAKPGRDDTLRSLAEKLLNSTRATSPLRPSFVPSRVRRREERPALTQSTGHNWACRTCTFVNPAPFFSCEMCRTEKPPQSMSMLERWHGKGQTC